MSGVDSKLDLFSLWGALNVNMGSKEVLVQITQRPPDQQKQLKHYQ